MNILICSQIGETQVEAVCQQLLNLGGNPILFERYRRDHFVTYHYDKEEIHAFLNIGGLTYKLTEDVFPVVWYRPKPILRSEIPGELANYQEKFCIEEWKRILQSLDIFLAKSKWVNPIYTSYRVANKGYQLKLAREVGLSIPETFITNNSHEVMHLFNGKRVIYKTLSSYFTEKQAIYSSEITKENVLSSHEAITMAPGIFQQYCEKKHELRVTVVGNKIFTVRINSQSKPSTLVDWRRDPEESMYEIGYLSTSMSQKLLAFHRQSGLIYAAYDFVVDNDENEIFLECNPSGQWLWLERAVDADISLAMAEELMKKG